MSNRFKLGRCMNTKTSHHVARLDVKLVVWNVISWEKEEEFAYCFTLSMLQFDDALGPEP